MKCSVIIPYYNRKKLLLNCLLALDRQDFDHRELEIVLIDDGSDDLNPGVIENLGIQLLVKYHKLARDEHSCAAKARNEGIKLATGEIIVFMDCDLIVRPDFISEHCAFIEECGDKAEVLQIGIRRHLYPQDCYDITSMDQYPYFKDVRKNVFEIYSSNLNSLLGKWHLAFSNNMSVSKATILKYGGFDSNFKGWGLEDCEFAYKLVKNGVRILYNPNIEAYHQFHEEVFNEDKYAGWKKNLAYFYEKHNDLPVIMQEVFSNFFDPEKREELAKSGIQNAWIYSFNRFENALRNLYSPLSANSGHPVYLSNPTIPELDEMANGNGRIAVVCPKENRKLISWVQLRDAADSGIVLLTY